MTIGELKRLARLLRNQYTVPARAIILGVYRGGEEPIWDGYLEDKVNHLLTDPLGWILSLDMTNTQRLIDMAEETRNV
jgi:hypothetical protein